MENFSLKIIIQKLISKKIEPQDFLALKYQLPIISEEELDATLKNIWDESSVDILMDEEIKKDVQKNLEINRQKINRTSRRFNWMKIAASIIFLLLFSVGSYYYFSSHYNTKNVQEFVVMADKGQKTQIYLPDGTHVWLNSGSKLTYSANYNWGERNVKLEGEAFFDVHKNPKLQFVVHTQKANIIVHGTAFNVSAYGKDSTLVVTLQRGSISLQNALNDKEITYMSINQQVEVNKNNMNWTIKACDAQEESLWINNKLKVEDESASEVYKKMERWYGVNIHVINAPKNNRYGFTIKTESLREMLDLINQLTPIKYTVNGEEVTISYSK